MEFFDKIASRAQTRQDHAVVLLANNSTMSLDWQGLHAQSQLIAKHLATHESNRAILFFPTSIAFIKSLFACLQAKIIAIPLPCPVINDVSTFEEHIKAVIDDAGVSMIICLPSHATKIQQLIDNSSIETVNDVCIVRFKPSHQPVQLEQDVAYLQYTSGSTSAPKAAVITHDNLLHSIKATIAAWNYQDNSKTLCFAPHTHVYGLVCGIFVPLFHGTPAYLMPTHEFIENPLLWLKAISEHRITHSGCPDFGYAHCARRIDLKECQNLDLSCWQAAINGGDLVRPSTVQAFIEQFSPFGFKEESFIAAYGMSEASGLISSSSLHSYKKHISLGRPVDNMQVLIIDPDTKSIVTDEDIGEIWLSGSSIINGYLNKPDINLETFNQQLNGHPNPWFRTGDLGFISEGEIYITGRLKELIIVHGKKYHPQDLEQPVADALLELNIELPGVAFSYIKDETERLAFIQEIPKSSEHQQTFICQKIKSILLNTHGLIIDDIIPVLQGQIPKTKSNKLQRSKAKKMWLEGELQAIFTASKEDLVKNILAYILSCDKSDIDFSAAISQYPLDSIRMIELSSKINETFNSTITPAHLYECQTLGDIFNLFAVNNPSPDIKEDKNTDNHNRDIAIIGMSVHIPGAKSLSEFKQLLYEGLDVIDDISNKRQELALSPIQFAGLIDDIEHFAATFFNCSPHEAALIDPQQRLFLHTVWHALEDANLSDKRLAQNTTGLFVGAMNDDHSALIVQNQLDDPYLTTSSGSHMIANRVSWMLNLQGPSETINTACSSSLVAVHHAVRALREKECDIAIVGGVNALLSAHTFKNAAKAGMLSVDGRCKSFDSKANGYVRSEGMIAIVLKTLDKAINDGDLIHGIIKGSAVNHGGHANSLTAPNPKAQAKLIVKAIKDAGVLVDEIDYIEAHGSATPLGDPIEINGLKEAFAQLAINPLPASHCAIGSVKNQIGHLESAAGLAGMVKVIMCMQHGFIPKNLHLVEENPYLKLNESPFYLPKSRQNWPHLEKGKIKYAGVSSFGFGGTNAHVVLAEAPKITASKDKVAHVILPISAKTPSALKKRIDDLVLFAHLNPDIDLYALSYTLCLGRSHFKHRCVIIINDNASLIDALQQALEQSLVDISKHEKLTKIAKDYLAYQDIDWSKILKSPRFLHLPVYPFETSAYPLPKKEHGHSSLSLIDSYEQTTHGLTCQKQFNPDDWFFKEHVINQKPLMPMAVWLSMLVSAWSKIENNVKTIECADLSLRQSLVDVQKDKVLLSINHHSFNISSANQLITNGFIRSLNTFEQPAKPIVIKDTDGIYIDKASFYQHLSTTGLDYGTQFQVVDSVLKYDNAIKATIQITNHTKGWHPALVDGILHATHPLLPDDANTYIPVKIKKITAMANLPSKVIVYAKKSNESPVLIDIEVYNESHELLMMIDSLELFCIENKQGKQLYEPKWIDAPISVHNQPLPALTIMTESPLMLSSLKNKFNQKHHEFMLLDNIDETYQSKHPIVLIVLDEHENNDILTAVKIHRLIRQWAHVDKDILIHTKPNNIIATALAAYAKTLHLEQQRIKMRIIECDSFEPMSDELHQQDVHVRYNPQRQITTLNPVDSVKDLHKPTAKTWLIAGGLGGIGKIITTFLSEQPDTSIMLCGRKALSYADEQWINQQQQNGTRIIYQQTDLSSFNEVKKLIDETVLLFGTLEGIIHSAGYTHDQLIENHHDEEALAVLNSKITGTLNLHHASKDYPIKHFILFSSVAALFGNRGQASYALANAWQDAFCAKRQLHSEGQSLSINWPLWQDGGILVDERIKQHMKQTLGIIPLQSNEGVVCFKQALSYNTTQLAVLPGESDTLLSAYKMHHLINMPAKQNLHQINKDDIIHELAASLNCSKDSILPHTPFEELGIDSLMIVNLNQRFSALFRDFPKTVFFECRNLAELLEYLETHYKDYFNHQQLPHQNPEKPETQYVTDEHDIAIVGISARFPKANHLEEFWHNLYQGIDCIERIPLSRFESEGFGGLLDDVDKFDPLFFNITPKDAALMDPQERLFLQTAWHSIEDAGFSLEDIKGQPIGVFVGVMYGHYQLYAHQGDDYVPTHSMFSSIANRVSYVLDINGPSMAVDTMCSSSLTALHLAVQSIRDGSATMALAGGVNLSVHQDKYLLLSNGHFLSKDGRCKSFGEGGDGYVPGEAVGCVVLKPYQQALEEGCHIYGIIKASQLNHGGKSNGYTVPNPKAQAALIHNTWKQSHINPAHVSYIEAHGTGTSLGDPIEINALTDAFKDYQDLKHCAIGSVKANIGHCESAAGIASLAKVLLQIKHKTLLPSIHARSLNKNIAWDKTPFKVQQEHHFWPEPRIAGISSFGAGGANAHVVLTEAPKVLEQKSSTNLPCLIALSAKTKEALINKINDLINWLTKHQDESLEDIAYTLNIGRSHFNHRCAFIVKDKTTLLRFLEKARDDQGVLYVDEGENPTLLSMAKDYLAQKTIDFKAMAQHQNKKRLSMPGYPFAKESYWYTDLLKKSHTNHENSISDILMNLLHLKENQIDLNKNFADYGMDSVHMVEFARIISEQFSGDFTPANFYLYPNIRQLSDFLNQKNKKPVTKTTQTSVDASIAIIGMAGRLACADTIDELYDSLISGHDMVKPVPKDRHWWKKVGGRDIEAGFIKEVQNFDASFFNISPREARYMDPQQRLLLQVAWQTFEDGGLNPLNLTDRNIGVFIGVEFHDYQNLLIKDTKDKQGVIATGNSGAMIANRISYWFNLEGPSETISTACSSSLVAIHRAMSAIQSGECNMALVGGVNLLLDPATFDIIDELGALSKDFRCKTFDKSANGYAKGEGIGCILIKNKAMAIEDANPILAIIGASAVNHGGKAQTLTAPNPNAQAALLLKAWSQNKDMAKHLSYIEAHGTGTALGDPVEIEAIKLALEQFGNTINQIGIGSIKSHIGHLEAAAGIAGVINILLSFRHEKIPGLLHFKEQNPHIKLNGSKLYIVKETKAWHAMAHPRVAAVSSFGFGGSNAHVLLQEYQTIDEPQQEKSVYMLALSAHHIKSLHLKIKDLLTWLKRAPIKPALTDLCHTLNLHRAHFKHRLAIICQSMDELMLILEELTHHKRPHHVCFGDNAAQFSPNGIHASMKDIALKYVTQGLISQESTGACLSGLPVYPFMQQSFWYDEVFEDSSLESINQRLRRMLADCLNIDPDKLQPDIPFESYGLDSVHALEFTRSLKEHFNDIPKNIVYENPTINQLEQWLTSKQQVDIKSPWLTHQSQRAEPRIRLFCFPYAGAGASVYRHWHEHLPDYIDVCPVQLPGREHRLNEHMYDNWSLLLEGLTKGLMPFMNMPFAFFGHSFGALLAYRLSLHLQQQQLATPEHVLLSAYPAPIQAGRSFMRMCTDFSNNQIDFMQLNAISLAQMSDDEVYNIIKIIQANGLMDVHSQRMDAGVLRVLLPAFLADMQLIKHDKLANHHPLPIDASIFYGMDDNWIDIDEMKGWYSLFDGQCQMHAIPGKHLFIQEETGYQRLMILINQILNGHSGENRGVIRNRKTSETSV